MKKRFNKFINKKIFLLSNSSRYIFQYRLLLLNELKNYFKEIYIVAPFDESSSELKKYGEFINWKILLKKNYSLINFTRSFTQLLFKIKKIKPDIVHSHTLKSNLLISMISFFLGINTVLSFAGMGRLSESKGFKKLFLRFILKIIYFLSIYNLENFFIRTNYKRVKFIFQNPIDIQFFINCFHKPIKNDFFYLIPGSGVPERYFNSIKKILLKKEEKIEFIYCARLEKSKGIKLFLDLSFYYPNAKFFVYGELSGSSDELLDKNQIELYKKKNKNLFFKNYVKDPLIKHHNNNSIFIIPSIYGEGLPRGILEALSLEIPVVASKKSCVGLFDKSNVFVAKDNNLNSYLEEIEKIISYKKIGILENFLNYNKKLVFKKYKETIIVKNTLELYEKFE